MLRPVLHTEPYSVILPENLVGLNQDKVAVITGAARGIGKAIAEALAKTGANVALLDLDLGRLIDTKTECERIGVKAVAYASDVTDHSRCQEVFAQIKQDLGPIDILVNNAGRNNRKPIGMESFNEFWTGIEVNLKGAMICSWLALPAMRERRQGCIINIASRAGTVSVPFATAYSTAKAGLIRATACMQAELENDGFGDSIHLYALHPGAVKTDMTIPVDPEVAKKYPAMAKIWALFHRLFKVLPSVCGQTCAFLSGGRGKVLRGRYFDCEQDIQMVLDAGKEGLDGLYDLKVEFLGGLPNDGGSALSIEVKK